eukprot:955742-Rhodomonas_salina.1
MTDYVAAKPSQPNSRPDGVALHEESCTLYFLEFMRAWDEGDSLRDVEECKAEQYVAAAGEQAVRASTCWKSQVQRVYTLSFVFGVRGSVLCKTLSENLLALDVQVKRCDAIITQGVQTAITEARQVCLAHHELAKAVPKDKGHKVNADWTELLAGPCILSSGCHWWSGRASTMVGTKGGLEGALGTLDGRSGVAPRPPPLLMGRIDKAHRAGGAAPTLEFGRLGTAGSNSGSQWFPHHL